MKGELESRSQNLEFRSQETESTPVSNRKADNRSFLRFLLQTKPATGEANIFRCRRYWR